jgi:hypothetical protein
MGRILDFHKRNCFAILVQSFFILAFIGGYIAFLTTFLNQNRDQVTPLPLLFFSHLLSSSSSFFTKKHGDRREEHII